MERVRLPALTVRVDGARIAAYTELSYAGAHQLTLSTALPALGVELHSSYLGHPDAAESIASHLQLGPDLNPHTWVETHASAELPVSEARRSCLYDHLPRALGSGARSSPRKLGRQDPEGGASPRPRPSGPAERGGRASPSPAGRYRSYRPG